VKTATIIATLLALAGSGAAVAQTQTPPTEPQKEGQVLRVDPSRKTDDRQAGPDHDR
jgi:hypothetical protein